MRQQKLTLYLPIGLVSSEKLLVMSGFLLPGQLEIVFVQDCLFFKDYSPSERDIQKTKNKSSFSVDSSDNVKDLESSYSGSMNSSFDRSLKNRRSNGNNKSQFDKNCKKTKYLDKQKLKEEEEGEVAKEKDVSLLMRYSPVLEVGKNDYVTDFIKIVLLIVRDCKFKNEAIKVKEEDYGKLAAYMKNIEKEIDFYANNLLYELYNVNENNKKDQFHIMDKNLKQLIKKLDYFETFLLVKNTFVFGESFGIIDLMLFGSLSKMFIFFFDKKIRSGCLYNTTKWFKTFLKMEEIHVTYGVINLCIKNYFSSFENLTEKSIKNLKMVENKFNQEFRLKGLEECLKRFITLRKERVKEKSGEIDMDNGNGDFDSVLKPKKEKSLVSSFNNSGIYQNCNTIYDLDLLILKTEETQLNNFKPDDYSVWVFEYIKEDEEVLEYNEDQETIHEQIYEFYYELLDKISNNSDKFFCYVVIYGNCEEFKGEENFDIPYEICEKHENKFFLTKNLKGFVVKKGQEGLGFLSDYESLDQIMLIRQSKENAIDILKDFIHQGNGFEMEKIYEEAIL